MDRYVLRQGIRRNGEDEPGVLVDLLESFIWHRNGTQPNGTERFKCSCFTSHNCRVYLSRDEAGFRTTGAIQHTHENEVIKIAELEFINYCKDESRNTIDRYQTIFHRACERYPNVNTVSLVSILSSMTRIRQTQIPLLPQDANEAHNLLLINPRFSLSLMGTNDFYCGRVQDGLDSALIFINIPLLHALVNAEIISMDATFDTVPFQFYQMASLHAMAYGHMFPVSYILMTRKTQRLYQLALHEINAKCFELHGRFPQPRILISDYELAILQAMAATFPNAQARGCWFHSCQAMLRKVRSLGLMREYRRNRAVKRIAKMAMALALLPSHLIRNGFEAIERYARESDLDVNTRMKINQFLVYVDDFWINRVGVERFSVYGAVCRTNNFVESWHNTLTLLMSGHHLNYWNFTRKLQISGFQAERDYGLIRGDNDRGNGYRIRDVRRATYELRDRNIARQAADLRANRITVREFLELASGQINPILPVIVEDEEEEEEEEIGQEEGAVGAAVMNDDRAAFGLLLHIQEVADPIIPANVGPVFDQAVGPAIDPAVGPAIDPAEGPAIDPVVGPAIDLAIYQAVDHAAIDPAVYPVHPAIDPQIENVNVGAMDMQIQRNLGRRRRGRRGDAQRAHEAALIVRNNDRRVRGEAQRVRMEARIARGVQRRALAAVRRARAEERRALAEERRALVIARRARVHGIGVRREGFLGRQLIVNNIPRNLPALVPINPAGYEPINMLAICLFCNVRQVAVGLDGCLHELCFICADHVSQPRFILREDGVQVEIPPHLCPFCEAEFRGLVNL